MNRILITGAISGIGLASSILFLQRGWKVIMADKNTDSEIMSQIEENFEKQVLFVKTDVSKEGEVKNLHQKILSFCDGVDCVVNNAGVITHGLLHEASEKIWDEVMNTDVKAIYYTSKFFIPDMIENGGGTIVNTASISGLAGDYKMPIYNAAKGAVVNLTRAIALDYAEYNIRVNSVCPSAVRTKFVSPNNIPKHAAANPLKRICEPEEVAKAIYFLASNESSYCNGVNLPITGGLDAHTGQPK